MLNGNFFNEEILFPLTKKSDKEFIKKKFYYRQFGYTHSDLEIEFDNKYLPFPEIALLQNCILDEDGNPPLPNLLWDLEISKRILLILLITKGTDTSDFKY